MVPKLDYRGKLPEHYPTLVCSTLPMVPRRPGRRAKAGKPQTQMLMNGFPFYEKRERFKRLAQNQSKLKTGKAFAAEVRRSGVHHRSKNSEPLSIHSTIATRLACFQTFTTRNKSELESCLTPTPQPSATPCCGAVAPRIMSLRLPQAHASLIERPMRITANRRATNSFMAAY
jgi:hypothetical protein